jgi:hypothetical protein
VAEVSRAALISKMPYFCSGVATHFEAQIVLPRILKESLQKQKCEIKKKMQQRLIYFFSHIPLVFF